MELNISSYLAYNGFHPDLSRLLQPWKEAKSSYLLPAFNNQLIHSTPISYSESQEEIEYHIHNLIFSDDRCQALIRTIQKHFSNGSQPWQLPPEDHEIYSPVLALFNYEPLATNRITKPVFSYPIGTKTIKAITRAAKEASIPASEIEYFRNRHSLALNTKILSGDLCLSIHPLDYMTMSDNANDWSSCMSWLEEGEYRQGTVEMMNSPSVVVAYLRSHEDNLTLGSDFSWNSKKWRCLFICAPDFICSVKSYPYYNPNLTKIALRELAKVVRHPAEEPQLLEDTDIFETNLMYNDFGCGQSHFYTGKLPTSFNYSGVGQCMSCGCTDGEVSLREDSLECQECDPYATCDSCGSRIYDGDSYTTADGYTYCDYCFDEETFEDAITGEYYSRSASENELSLLNENDETINTILLHSLDLPSRYFNLSCPRKGYFVYPSDCTPLGLELFEKD